jgi:hypothetical protein
MRYRLAPGLITTASLQPERLSLLPAGQRAGCTGGAQRSQVGYGRRAYSRPDSAMWSIRLEFDLPAVIVLTQEEAVLVRSGRIEEPGYRAFPSGSRARREREWEIIQEEAGEDLLELEYSEPSPVATLERILAAHHWTRSTLTAALLLARRGEDASAANSGLHIVALSRAEGGPRGKMDGTRRVEIGPWESLSPPLPIEVILSQLDQQQKRTLLAIIDEAARPLPPKLSASIDAVLQRLIPEYMTTLRNLTRPSNPRRRLDDLERRDSTATALSILTPHWRSLQPEPGAQPSDLATYVESRLRVNATENDFITDDSAVFPEWDRSTRPVAGWWTFRHKDRVMHIKNINVSPAETATGADLVYVRDNPSAVVLVQYKRLSRNKSGEVLMEHDSRLARQVDRMLTFSDDSRPRVLADHRIGPEFAFVKFIDNQAQSGLSETELTRGRYIPAGYIRELLAAKPQGPRGGRVIYVDRERSLDSSVFVGLVRECWIGSRGATSEILAELVRAPAASITLAINQQG